MLLFGSFCPTLLEMIQQTRTCHCKAAAGDKGHASPQPASLPCHRSASYRRYEEVFTRNSLLTEDGGALLLCSWHGSRNFFWNPASTTLE